MNTTDNVRALRSTMTAGAFSALGPSPLPPLFGTVAMTIAAAQFGMIGFHVQPMYCHVNMGGSDNVQTSKRSGGEARRHHRGQ